MKDGNIPTTHNYSFDTLDLDPLPSLFDELPPLEEAPITSRLEVNTCRQVRATTSFLEQRQIPGTTGQDEINRQHSSRPALKVRDVQRLLEQLNSKPSPFHTRENEYLQPTKSESEESDIIQNE